MAYFPDLTQYVYSQDSILPARQGQRLMLNVGWLDDAHPFPTASPTPAFVTALSKACLVRFNQTRGFHICAICPKDVTIARIHSRRDGLNTVTMPDGREIFVGSAEIHVETPDTTTLVAPNLILHYVMEHHYAPPEDFTSSILAQYGQ